MLQKLINFRFLGSALFFTGYLTSALLNTAVGENGTTNPFLTLFAPLFTWLMPLGFIVGVIRFSQRWGQQTSQVPPVIDESGNVVTPPVQRRTPIGLILFFGGLLFAFFPLIVATMSTSPGHNMWDESDPQSGGAMIWLMLFTLPIGGVIALVGLSIAISRAVKTSNTQSK